jgi:hypothetical protein
MTDGWVHLLYNSSWAFQQIATGRPWSGQPARYRKGRWYGLYIKYKTTPAGSLSSSQPGWPPCWACPLAFWHIGSPGRLRFIEYKPPKIGDNFSWPGRDTHLTLHQDWVVRITGSLAGISKLGICSIAFFRPSHHTLSSISTFLLWQLTKSIMAFFLYVFLSLFHPRYVVTKSLH